jgi:hypothetical protein
LSLKACPKAEIVIKITATAVVKSFIVVVLFASSKGGLFQYSCGFPLQKEI